MKWEYKLETWKIVPNEGALRNGREPVSLECLNAHGADGWEVVAVRFSSEGHIHSALLKRLAK